MPNATNKRETSRGCEYYDGDYWISERDTCHHCADEREAAGKPYRWADEQYSMGCYAGRYCETCWPKSGYRDAIDPDVRFNPADAGESLEEI